MRTLIKRIQKSIESEILKTQDLVKSDEEYPETALAGVIARRKSFIFGLQKALEIIEEEVKEDERSNKIKDSMDLMMEKLDRISNLLDKS